MRIRTITTAATIAALSTVGFAGTAMALPGSTVPGHTDRTDGDVISTHLNEQRDGCMLVMNAHGAATDPADGEGRMLDGHMMNTWVCDDGSVTTYHIFHESHPRFTEDLEPIWNEWGYFATTNKAGR